MCYYFLNRNQFTSKYCAMSVKFYGSFIHRDPFSLDSVRKAAKGVLQNMQKNGNFERARCYSGLLI